MSHIIKAFITITDEIFESASLGEKYGPFKSVSEAIKWFTAMYFMQSSNPIDAHSGMKYPANWWLEPFIWWKMPLVQKMSLNMDLLSKEYI